VITNKITWDRVVYVTAKFVLMKLGRKPLAVHLEVTKNCGLRCNFCDYWRTGKEERLDDYLPVIQKLDPLSVVITGGEPLIRRDLSTIISRLKKGMNFVYLSLTTSGYLLTVDRGLDLWNAGLDHLTISLDFLGEEHDKNRGRKGLYQHIAGVAPRLVEAGVDNLVFNTMIMEDNLEMLPAIVKQANDWGCKVSFSTYHHLKVGNWSHRVKQERIARLQQVIDEILVLKRSLGNITNSDYYLERVPQFFNGNGGIPNCAAGTKLLQVTPDGHIKRCADKEVLGHWRSFDPSTVSPTSCTECWYACRGEAEAPLGVRRIIELNR